jgi:hypothetical protein
MRVPPPRHPANMEEGAGLWIELRDAKGIPIYRRALESQTFKKDTEIRTGTTDRPFVRRPGKKINTIFSAVIPDKKKGATFHVLERRPGTKKIAPDELAKINLSRIEY